MKVVIQDAASREYLARNGTWTLIVRDAEDFRSNPKMQAMASPGNTRSVRVVLYFEDLDYSIAARRGQDYRRLFAPGRPNLKICGDSGSWRHGPSGDVGSHGEMRRCPNQY